MRCNSCGSTKFHDQSEGIAAAAVDVARGDEDVVDSIASQKNLTPTAKENLAELTKQGLKDRQHYKVQKWCATCQVREEAIMYADSVPKLEAFLDEQSRKRKHPHKVERSIVPVPIGTTYTDFRRVPY